MIRRHLPIRVRRVTHVGGEQERLTVYCLERQALVDVDECLRCTRCEGMHVDSSDRHTFLVCRGEPPPLEVQPEGPGDDWEDPPISSLMSDKVICVRPDTTLDTLALLFIERNISGAPVIDADGRPIGVVTKTDLLREHTEHGDTEVTAGRPLRVGEYEVDLGPGFHELRSCPKTVAEIMMPLTFCLRYSERLSTAAALMAHEGVHRIVVVSETGGEVVGVLSALDVLRWTARRYGYLVPLARERE